jgi:hypothetical protein
VIILGTGPPENIVDFLKIILETLSGIQGNSSLFYVNPSSPAERPVTHEE